MMMPNRARDMRTELEVRSAAIPVVPLSDMECEELG